MKNQGLELIAMGLSDEEISQNLGCHRTTVKRWRQDALNKLSRISIDSTKKRKKRNFISLNDVKNHDRPHFYPHQEAFLQNTSRVRMCLKSRQVGFSYAIAYERLIVALETGKNQIFISGSQRQAMSLQKYIKMFARNLFGIELIGTNEIEINTEHGAVHLYFLANNPDTAQSYHGDLIIDEMAWIPRLKEMLRVAKPMAIQKQYTQTFITTPSFKTHFAYEIWKGENGFYENMFRYEINLQDAIKLGYDLIDQNDVRQEYEEADIEVLFDVNWIDDIESYIPSSLIEACLVDEAETHYKGGQCFLGYDPSRTRDSAALVVLERRLLKIINPEKHRNEKGWHFVIVNHQKLINKSSTAQAKCIEEAVKNYNVTHVGLDRTGMGWAVWDQLDRSLCRFKAIDYSLERKTELVTDTRTQMEQKQLVFSAEDRVMIKSIAKVRRCGTEGNRLTFKTDRKKDKDDKNLSLGHADSFWALTHALHVIPPTLKKTKRRGILSTNF